MEKWNAEVIGRGINHQYGVEVYVAEEVEAHIAEMQRSHDVTTAMLKASLAEAQQAIKQVTAEAKKIDQATTKQRERIAELETALRDLLLYLDEHDWGTIPEGETADRARSALGKAADHDNV